MKCLKDDRTLRRGGKAIPGRHKVLWGDYEMLKKHLTKTRLVKNIRIQALKQNFAIPQRKTRCQNPREGGGEGGRGRNRSRKSDTEAHDPGAEKKKKKGGITELQPRGVNWRSGCTPTHWQISGVPLRQSATPITEKRTLWVE